MIDHQSAVVLGAQADALDGVQDWRDLERWADWMVAMLEPQSGRGGCPIGTLAAALADTDEQFRAALNDVFESWRGTIGAALARLRDSGLLAADANLEQLTTTMLAAIQGGLLLAKTSRDNAQLRVALDGAIAQLRTHSVSDKRRACRCQQG